VKVILGCELGEQFKVVMGDIHHWYGGQSYTPKLRNAVKDTQQALLTLYNNDMILAHLQQLERHGRMMKVTQALSSVHSIAVLNTITANGPILMNNIVDLQLQGSVSTPIVTEFGFADLLEAGKDPAITWALMKYMGS